MNYTRTLIIVDLEATCFARGEEPNGFFSEIIEIGAVVYDCEKRKAVEEYARFVKPVLFPVLSEFCKTLTTITQEQVDQGISLPQACQELQTLVCRTDALFCSWGYYDRKMFQQSCSRFGLPYPFSDRHVSLKHAHRDYYGYGKKMGMKQALSYHGLKLDGVHHRGIDDARNIAKIVTRMLEDGYTVP